MFSAKNQHFLLITGGIIIALYVLLKACLIAITHDEAYSFYIVKNFWYAEAFCTGNTHWLNTAAIKLAVLFGLENVPGLRFFSLISSGIFFLISIKLLKNLQEKSLVLFGFALLLLNPYVLDYFCLARGYASGMMLELLSLYLLFNSKPDNKKQAFYALVCAAFSVMSNYSFSYFFVAFAGFYFVMCYRQQGLQLFKQFGFYRDISLVCLLLAFLLRSMIFLKSCSNDYVGAGTDNFSYFLAIIPFGLSYFNIHFSSQMVFILNYLILLGLMLLSVYGAFFYHKHKNNSYQITASILLLTLSIIIIAFFVFHMVLPANRSALFLFPISVLTLVLALNSVKFPAFKKLLLTTVGIILVINFVLNCNLKYNLDFKFNANVADVFSDLDAHKAKTVALPSGFYGAYRNYYYQKKTKDLTFKALLLKADDTIDMTNLVTDPGQVEYMVLLPPYSLHYYRQGNFRLKTLKYYKESKAYLFKIEH